MISDFAFFFSQSIPFLEIVEFFFVVLAALGSEPSSGDRMW